MSLSALRSPPTALLRMPALATCLLVLAGCAGFGNKGREGLLFSDPVQALGPPAMEWRFSSGARQLAYPPPANGVQSYMVYLAPDGTLSKVEGVLDDEHFSLVVVDHTDRDSVLRLLGPPRDRL